MRRISSVIASIVLVFSTVLYIPTATAAGGPGVECQADGIPIASFGANDWTGVGPFTIQLDGASYSSGCGDAIVSYDWSFGDGSTSTNAVTAHTFAAGTWNVSLQVTDEAGLVSTASSSLTVRATNATPVAGNDVFTFTYVDSTYSSAVSVNDSDADSDWLRYTAESSPVHGTVTMQTNGYFTYTPEDGFSGQDSFTYTASDIYEGVSTPAVVTIQIPSAVPQNTAPVANNDTLYTNEDAPKTITILSNDTDVDGDTLTTTLGSIPQNIGTVTLNPDQTISYTPAANYNGTFSFDYTVSDGKSGQSTAQVRVNVTAVNDAPVANVDNVNTTEDTAVTFNVLENDTDLDNILSTTTVATAPTHGTLNALGNGTYRYTPNANYFGTDSFSYRVSDAGGLKSLATVDLSITTVNDAPVAAFRQTVGKARSVQFNSQSTDIDGDSLSYRWNFGDGSTSTLSAPSHAYARKGTYTVTLTVTDIAGATTTTTKQIII